MSDLKFNDEAREAFLALYSKSGLFYQCAHEVGVTGSTVQRHIKRDEKFAEQVEEAKKLYTDSLVAEVHRRGVEGVPSPKFYRGQRCDLNEEGEPTVMEYSDRLLELYLKRMDPSFRESIKVDGNVSHGVLVVDPKSENYEEWAKRFGTPVAEEPEEDDEIHRQ